MDRKRKEAREDHGGNRNRKEKGRSNKLPPRTRPSRSPEHNENRQVRKLTKDQLDLQYRKKTINFINFCGKMLWGNENIQAFPVKTACVFLHKFVNHHGFKNHDRFEVSTACLHLSGKVCEKQRKLDYVLKVCMKQQAKVGRGVNFVIGTPDYDRYREKILKIERVLLQTMEFRLNIRHPYNHYLKYCSLMKGKISEDVRKSIAKIGWSILNDSYYTTVLLEHRTQEIAICCVIMAENEWARGHPNYFKPQGNTGNTPNMRPTNVMFDHFRRTHFKCLMEDVHQIKKKIEHFYANSGDQDRSSPHQGSRTDRSGNSSNASHVVPPPPPPSGSSSSKGERNQKLRRYSRGKK